jgi:hypothetical protein
LPFGRLFGLRDVFCSLRCMLFMGVLVGVTISHDLYA